MIPEFLLHMTDLDKPNDEPLLPKRNKVTGLQRQKGLNLYVWENERSESVSFSKENSSWVLLQSVHLSNMILERCSVANPGSTFLSYSSILSISTSYSSRARAYATRDPCHGRKDTREKITVPEGSPIECR